MRKGIFAICILAIFIPALAGCARRASPAPSVLPVSPQASKSLSPPATPLPSAAATTTATGIPAVTPISAETPVPAASGAGGTLPNDLTFSNYSSPTGNYDVQAPDGWKGQESGANARFTKNWNGMQVEITRTADPFTPDAIKTGPVADLIRTGRAVAVRSVAAVTAKSGTAILVVYECNSEPQGGKQVRLENQRYYFYRNGSLAALTLWAPLGANNWKLWAQMADTFEWRQS